MNRSNRTKSKYFYHLTTANLGKIVRLTPTPDGAYRPCEEPKVSRICVGPSIAHCMIAIPLWKNQKYYVYRTKRRVSAFYPFHVEDSSVTKERWLRSSILFVKIGTFWIDNELYYYDCLSFRAMKWGKSRVKQEINKLNTLLEEKIRFKKIK